MTYHPNLWHPCTQMKTTPSPLKIKAGKGAKLYLEDGSSIIDAISSWWVNIHGHSHPKIAQAIYEQALQLEHVIFAGFSHDPAEKLAENLTSVLPPSLTKVFFSDCGSTAIEVALKQAYQYWKNLGEEKRVHFICFEQGYHGETLGALSLGAKSVFTKAYENLLFKVTAIPYPNLSEDILTKEQDTLALLEDLLIKNPQSYAALIIEPLVQGAGGMRMCREEFLQQLCKLCQKYQVLVIYDEIMTGFGRTGDWFACLKSQTVPDILCLSKGLTGGFLPLAVTVCSSKIFDAFYSDDPHKTFFHSHSYTANPLGCAAANASLALLKENEQLFKGMEQRHRHFSKNFTDHPLVTNLRFCGTIAAMDVVDRSQLGYLNPIGTNLRYASLKKGVLIRPLGPIIYLMPPYCITDEELQYCYTVIQDALEEQQGSSSTISAVSCEDSNCIPSASIKA